MKKIDFDKKFSINCAMMLLAEKAVEKGLTKEQFLKFANSKKGLELAVKHAKEALKYLKDDNFTFN